jgi:hypothetical protein
MYIALMQPNMQVHNNNKMETKIKLKIKVFAWYLCRSEILTNDNLERCTWHGSSKCVLCHHDNTIEHLLFKLSK